jgi:hypothetical protein
MTGSDREHLMRHWAAKQLGVSPEATPAEARAAFLRQLPDEEFVPAPALVRGARALAAFGSDVPPDPRAEAEALQEAEEAVRAEIEDFADQYWEISVGPRRAKWEALMARADFSRSLRTRLRDLEAGLNIADPGLPAGVDPYLRELASTLCNLYVLRQARRARAWQDSRKQIRIRMWDWKDAALACRERYPALAALLPNLIEELVSWWGPQSYNPPRTARALAAEAQPRQQYRWVIAVLLLGVSSIVRTLSGIGNYTAPPPEFPNSSRPPVFREDDIFKQDGKRPSPSDKNRDEPGRRRFPEPEEPPPWMDKRFNPGAGSRPPPATGSGPRLPTTGASGKSP